MRQCTRIGGGPPPPALLRPRRSPGPAHRRIADHWTMAAMAQQQGTAQQQQPQPPPAAAAAAPVATGTQRQHTAAAAAAAAAAEERPPGKCNFYLTSKRRHCKFDVVPGKRFCGNHMYEGEGEGPKRVACPWAGPKGGHTVLESELEKHKLKCPSYLQFLKERAEPFFSEDVNAGPAEAAVAWAPEVVAAAAAAAAGGSKAAADGGTGGSGGGAGSQAAAEADTCSTAAAATAQSASGGTGSGGGSDGKPPRASALQAAYAASLGEPRFEELLSRVEAACKQVCEPEPLSVLIPHSAEPLLLPESATEHRPFSLKHAQQQASIIGNMQARGLLERAAEVTYVEYGAGKGYLSQMLGACSEASKLVMMDVRGFKQKADRGMRHLEMQRLRCDIKDFDVAQVSGLQGGAAPWVAFGKHLCGAATDFTLRSCARELQKGQGQGRAQGQGQGVQQQQGQVPGGQQEEEAQPQAQAAAAAVAGESEAACSTHGIGGGSSGGGGSGGVRGLAVATCCHHRCSWQHFVAKREVTELGFSPEEFELIVWMTGWALCGHEAPAGFGDGDGEGGQEPSPPQQDSGKQQAEQRSGTAAEQQGGASAVAEQQGTAKGHKRGWEEAASTAAAAAGREAGEPWRPQLALPRERKIAVGQQCKALVDAARLRWLRRQGFQASLAKYTPAAVSGENRLLLAVVGNAEAAAGC